MFLLIPILGVFTSASQAAPLCVINPAQVVASQKGVTDDWKPDAVIIKIYNSQSSPLLKLQLDTHGVFETLFTKDPNYMVKEFVMTIGRAAIERKMVALDTGAPYKEQVTVSEIPIASEQELSSQGITVCTDRNVWIKLAEKSSRFHVY